MANCSTCKTDSSGDFCSSCGNPLVIHRIDKSYLTQELLKLIGYERGFLYTAKGLLLRPGKVIREYIEEDRQKITKPITYLILTSLIYTFISHYFKTDMIQNEMLKRMYGDSLTYQLFYWVQNNYGYANLLLLVPITLWARFLFGDYKYNLYETFVVMSLVMAEGMLLYTLHVVLNFTFPTIALLNEFIMGFIMLVYLTWSIGQFYEGKRLSYFKVLLSYVLGMVTFQVVIVIVGTILSLILK
ncbi:DUF3667 domain-containing protein [Myroides odoratus]|uniref:DUF3667 domain-containing protein n=1 Tax=Myroides odoratus TaxID=256 RepID=A0A9Q6Z424_MYROD|nr:DUF3667 domain-containing protein [Myroides odoratus]EHQ41848.1 hypothetical protein Myrod_1014 [Myroides odoratus DSM 2801]EKB09061.1 hypothetical protein HMPREF9716_00429 [Myroides odoratus CIP 103059]QQT99245.1 DUF3667 domain-containing protein [Myroides odoratus]WQD58556.1 DUF3667 domain-containing protein [Myroides odoratus]STZ29110.1 Protein of uncharacterised function (DUF3667) [Myroides odoratus]